MERAVISKTEGNDSRMQLLVRDMPHPRDSLSYFVFLQVEGVGLRDVMTKPGIIGARTTSNHIVEVESVLGIEAARCVLW